MVSLIVMSQELWVQLLEWMNSHGKETPNRMLSGLAKTKNQISKYQFLIGQAILARKMMILKQRNKVKKLIR